MSHGKVDEAIAIMKEVAEWGRNQGMRVWLDEWLTRDELITEDAQPENFCIGKYQGKVACAFILQWKDSKYWPTAEKNEAAYLHKFCVCREFAHMGMTKLVIEAIKKECKKKGARYIRLDTGLDETVVRKIYLDAGFKIVKILDRETGRSTALYELEVWQQEEIVKLMKFFCTVIFVIIAGWLCWKFGSEVGKALGDAIYWIKH